GLGGAESFMMNLYRKIDRSKYQFDFLIYDDFTNVTDYHEEIKQLGGRIFVVANPKKNIIKYLFQVNRLLKKESFDVAHNEVYFGGGINLWLAKKNGIKHRIAHSHATEDGKSQNIIMNILRFFLTHLLLNNATEFLAVSQEAGQSLFREHPFKIIHNGIDMQMYKKNNEVEKAKRSELSIPDGAFIVGNIGRLEKQKNQIYLLDVFSEIIKIKSNSYLLIVGEGSLRLELENKINELGISDKVTLLGERNDIPELLSIIDVFVMTSLYEGLPMVGLEAQAAEIKLVLAETISKDTKLTNNVIFLPLKATKKEWAKQILLEPYTNEITPDLEQYDVSYTAKQMEAIYNKSIKN
ncbi:glycosyltransferase family 1 protein, partial [Enterococcus mundtii]|uniref:glycosyltransferase family 1 protein n=2 Tax=Enterococcus TaxID=1350 RepID=UPI0015E68C2A